MGAVVGKAQASTQAQAGPGEVHAEVDGRAAGQVLAESTTAKAKLPAWDVGAQRLRHTVRIPGAAGGVCTLRVWPHDEAQSVAGVQGQFTVTRLVDKAQEKARVKHQRNLVAEQKALVLRGELKAKLVAGGADPQYREKTRRAREARELEEKRQLEIKIQIEREENLRRNIVVRKREAARLKAERAKRQASARRKARVPYREPEFSAEAMVELGREHTMRQSATDAALKTRSRVVAWCLRGGADPYHRARMRQAEFNRRQAQEREQREREAASVRARQEKQLTLDKELTLDLHTRQRLSAWLIASGADPEYRRKQEEAGFREFEARARASRAAQVRATAPPRELVVSVEAPSAAKPAPPQELRPARPSSESQWIPGFYQWRAGAWLWVAGVWSTPPAANAIWIPSAEIVLGGTLVIQPGSWRTRSGRRVRGKGTRVDKR